MILALQDCPLDTWGIVDWLSDNVGQYHGPTGAGAWWGEEWRIYFLRGIWYIEFVYDYHATMFVLRWV